MLVVNGMATPSVECVAGRARRQRAGAGDTHQMVSGANQARRGSTAQQQQQQPSAAHVVRLGSPVKSSGQYFPV